MATENTISVTVTLGSPALTQAGFGKILLLVEAESTVFATRTKTYANLTEVDVDWAVTDEEYLAAQAAFTQDAPPAGFKMGRFEAADTNYTNALNAIKLADNDWYFLCCVSRDSAKQALVAAWAEANGKIALFGDDDKTSVFGLALKALGYDRSAVVYHSECDGSTGDLWPEVAWASRMSITTPGSTYWAEKDVKGVTADTLTTTEINALKAANVSFFTESARGVTLPYQGKVASGEWIDTIHFADWQAEEIAFRVEALKIAKSFANSKIPATSKGITMYEGAIRGALDLGVTNGGLESYTLTMPNIADVSDADKLARLLKNIQIVGKLAGAFIYVNIAINLEV